MSFKAIIELDYDAMRQKYRGRSWADFSDDEEEEYEDNQSSKDDSIISFPKPVILPSLIQEEEERIKNSKITEEEINLLPKACPWTGKPRNDNCISVIPSVFQSSTPIEDKKDEELITEDNISVEVSDKRSRACKSVTSEEKCLKGSCCTFAHTIEELNPIACKFGMSCKFIFSDTKTCFFVHPEETKEMYCKRNLIFQAKKQVQHTNNSFSSYKRTEGFNKLSNVKDTIRKTKVCEVLLKYGKCNREVCNFAHNSKEYKPECVFGNSCKKRECTFRHHPETIEKYCERMNIKLPKKF